MSFSTAKSKKATDAKASVGERAGGGQAASEKSTKARAKRRKSADQGTARAGRQQAARAKGAGGAAADAILKPGQARPGAVVEAAVAMPKPAHTPGVRKL